MQKEIRAAADAALKVKTNKARVDKELVSERIYRDISKWGYDLWINDLDDGIMNGVEAMTDTMRSQMYMTARDAGYAEARLSKCAG